MHPPGAEAGPGRIGRTPGVSGTPLKGVGTAVYRSCRLHFLKRKKGRVY